MLPAVDAPVSAVRKLNGWQRLWIVLSTVYLLPVIGLTILIWPSPQTMWHRNEFLEQMPPEVRKKIESAYMTEYEARKASGASSTDSFPTFPPKGQPAEDARPVPPGAILVSSAVQFPNGAVLQIHVAKEGDKEPDVRAAAAHWTVVESAARTARWQTARQMILLWVIPCFMLYALGWAVAWVRRGFARG